MATRTSELLVKLIDGVTGPAAAASRGLLGIPKAVRKANGQMMSFGDRMGVAIAANNEALDKARVRLFDAVAGFYVLNNTIGGSIRSAMAFESAMADVRKVVDFPTPKAFTDFQKDLIDLSKTIPMSVEGLAQIAAAAGQAGIAREDIIAFTEAAAKIGVAFDISADQAGDAIAKLMTGLGISLEQAISLTDAMNHLSNSQASSAAEILDVVRRVGAQAKMYGFTAEQTAAFASAMISAGAESEVAATSFRNMGKALTIGSAATKRQKDAFKALGMDAKKVAKAMQKDAVATTMLVLEALAKLPEEQRAAISSQLFGDEARALGPLLTNLGLVKDSVGLVADQTAYAGSSFKEFEARSKTLAAKMQQFRNKLAAIGITIGNALIPAISDLLDRLAPVLEWVGEFVSRHPDLVAAIVAITAAVIGLRVAMAALSYAGLVGRGGVLAMLAFGASLLGGSVGYLWNAARASIALQAALAAMSGAKLSAWGTLAVGARGMIFAVPGVSALASAIGAIGSAIGTISAPAWALFAAIAAAVAYAGLTIWKYWDRISSVLSGVSRAVTELLQPAFDSIRPVLEWFAPIGDAIASGWKAAGDAIAAVGDWFSSFFQREALTDEEKASYEQAGYDTVMAFWDGMKRVFNDLVAWVTAQVDRVLAPFLDAKNAVSGWFGGAGGGEATGVTSDPMGSGIDGANADGGPMTAGRTYLVGEEGPELVTPSKNGYVHPNGSGFGGGSAGGGSVTISPVFNISGASREDAQAIAEKVMALMDREFRSIFNGAYADTGLRTY